MIVLVFFLATLVLPAQEFVQADRWPWEDRRPDAWRRGVLITPSGEADAAVLAYTDADGFRLSVYDTLLTRRWSHTLPTPLHAVTAHVFSSATVTSAIVVAVDGDSVIVHGISVDRGTGTIVRSGRLHGMEFDIEGRPTIVHAASGAYAAVICRNDDDPSAVLLFNDRLEAPAVITSMSLPTFDPKKLQQPLHQWVADTLHIITMSMDDGPHLIDARLWPTGSALVRTPVVLTATSEADLEDAVIEMVEGGKDSAALVMQERNGNECIGLQVYRFSVRTGSGSAQRYKFEVDQRPQYARTRSVMSDANVVVGIERVSTFYKRQMTTNVATSIYTVGDGSVIRFTANGAQWRAPLMRSTTKGTAGTCEMQQFGLVAAPIAMGNDHVVVVNYREDADRMITAQVFDRTTGTLTTQAPLAMIHQPTYVFLEQWIIMPSHRKVWALFGDEIRILRY
ncbi:MAG: hypothetical protein JSS89_10530 [Bacteroidetes bacterium]|nr:hypothetical protein [Bacteroidota bacterium]